MKHARASALLALAVAGLLACSPPAPEEVSATETGEDGVTLIIRFEASEQGVTELKEILDGVAEAMKSEAGFVSAKVYRNIDDPNVFILEEVWETKELHGEHYDRINQSGDWAHIKSLLVADPQMGYYSLNVVDAE